MTDRSFRYCSNAPVGHDYVDREPDFGTMEERQTLAHRSVRHDGLEGWKAVLFIVAPAAFLAMVEAERARADLLTPSDG